MIVRDYFPYITETKTTTFTDCATCLVTFTNSRFNNDASLNAIAFLRFCADKLAEGVVCSDWNMNHHPENGDEISSEHKDDQIYFWVPLLSGLSKLTTDSRTAIRKIALEVYFDIFKDHGNLFRHSFWNSVFESVINPMFHKVHYMLDQFSRSDGSKFFEDDSWNPETTLVAAQSLLDLFIKSFVRLRPQLGNVVENLTCIIVNPHQQYSNTDVTVLLHLMDPIGGKLSEIEWRDALLLLKKATTLSLSFLRELLKLCTKLKHPILLGFTLMLNAIQIMSLLTTMKRMPIWRRHHMLLSE